MTGTSESRYTGNHWTMTMCLDCGVINADLPRDDERFGLHIFRKEECPLQVQKEEVRCTADDAMTHTAEIETVYECPECRGIRTTATSKQLAHVYLSTVTEPTCTEEGYTEDICPDCDYTVRRDVTPAAGHRFGDWITDQEPGIGTEGQSHRTCSVCGLVETQTLEALPVPSEPESGGDHSPAGHGDEQQPAEPTPDEGDGKPELTPDEGGSKPGLTPDEGGSKPGLTPDEGDGKPEANPGGSSSKPKPTPGGGSSNPGLVPGTGSGSTGPTTGGIGGSRMPDVVTDPDPDLIEHRAYVTGYPDGLFQPDQNISRAEMAALFGRILTEQNGGSVPAEFHMFVDVPTDAWYAPELNYLAHEGIVEGVGLRTFLPERPITRAEFAAMAVRAFSNEDPDETGTLPFADVRPESWAASAIRTAARQGWIIGDENGNFRPEDPITRAESVTALNRILDRHGDTDYITRHASQLKTFPDVKPEYWAFHDIMEAANTHRTLPGTGEHWSR